MLDDLVETRFDIHPKIRSPTAIGAHVAVVGVENDGGFDPSRYGFIGDRIFVKKCMGDVDHVGDSTNRFGPGDMIRVHSGT